MCKVSIYRQSPYIMILATLSKLTVGYDRNTTIYVDIQASSVDALLMLVSKELNSSQYDFCSLDTDYNSDALCDSSHNALFRCGVDFINGVFEGQFDDELECECDICEDCQERHIMHNASDNDDDLPF